MLPNWLSLRTFSVTIILLFFSSASKAWSQPVQAGPDVPPPVNVKYETIIFGDEKVCKGCLVSDTDNYIKEIRMPSGALYPLGCNELVLRDNQYRPLFIGGSENGVNCSSSSSIGTYPYFKFFGDQYYKRYLIDQDKVNLNLARSSYHRAFWLAPDMDKPSLNIRLALLSYYQGRRYIDYWDDSPAALLELDSALFFLKWNGPTENSQQPMTNSELEKSILFEIERIRTQLNLNNREASLNRIEFLKTRNLKAELISECEQLLAHDSNDEKAKAEIAQQRPQIWSKQTTLPDKSDDTKTEWKLYVKSIEKKIVRKWKEPEIASPMHLKFNAEITFSLDEQGRLLRYWLCEPSGYKDFDESAAQAVVKASFFGKPPQIILDNISGVKKNIYVFMNFHLKTSPQ